MRVNFWLFSSQLFDLWGSDDSLFLRFGDCDLGGSLSCSRWKRHSEWWHYNGGKYGGTLKVLRIVTLTWLEVGNCPSHLEHLFFHLEQHRLEYFVSYPLSTTLCPISLLVLWNQSSKEVLGFPFTCLAGHSWPGLHLSAQCFLHQAKPLRPQLEHAQVDTQQS